MAPEIFRGYFFIPLLSVVIIPPGNLLRSIDNLNKSNLSVYSKENICIFVNATLTGIN